MPFIKTNKAQQIALEEINEKLDALTRLSPLLCEEDSVALTITIGQGRGSVKIPMSSKDKERKKILAVIEEYRRRLAKEIKDKAKKFSIELTDEEKALLGGQLPESDMEDDSGDSDEDAEISNNLTDEETGFSNPMQASTPDAATPMSGFSAERARFGDPQ